MNPRRLFLVAVVALCASLAPACGSPSSSGPPPAAPAPSPPVSPGGTTVDLPGGGRGYLVLPQGTGRHPAVVVIQEWWGLNDWIRENKARFAGQGYVALAVDL